MEKLNLNFAEARFSANLNVNSLPSARGIRCPIFGGLSIEHAEVGTGMIGDGVGEWEKEPDNATRAGDVGAGEDGDRRNCATRSTVRARCAHTCAGTTENAAGERKHRGTRKFPSCSASPRILPVDWLHFTLAPALSSPQMHLVSREAHVACIGVDLSSALLRSFTRLYERRDPLPLGATKPIRI